MSVNRWFTADLHLGHSNIVHDVSEWKDKSKCRNFKTLHEHNEFILNKINSYCLEDDELYLAGDFSMGGKDNVEKFRKKIRCKNIHFIEGNHDIHLAKNYNNVQSLFSSYNVRLKKKFGKNLFIIDHYPIFSWENKYSGAIHLYGHVHGRLPFMHRDAVNKQEAGEWLMYGVPESAKYRAMDIGIDTHPEFRPYHLDEILNIMSNRINKKNIE